MRSILNSSCSVVDDTCGEFTKIFVQPDISLVFLRSPSPGRFFAVNELKALIGHVLMTYDIKFENNGGFPDNDWNGASVTPNRLAQVMFRKREA